MLILRCLSNEEGGGMFFNCRHIGEDTSIYIYIFLFGGVTLIQKQKHSNLVFF